MKGNKLIGELEAYPDSAADCTLVGVRYINKIGLKYRRCNPQDEAIDAANKSPFTVLGKTKVKLHYFGKQVEEEVNVVLEDTVMLIQWNSCITLGILHPKYPAPLEARQVQSHIPSQPSNLAESLLSKVKNPEEPTEAEVEGLKKDLLKEYEDVFSIEEQLRPMACKPMMIELKPGAIPTHVGKLLTFNLLFDI